MSDSLNIFYDINWKEVERQEVIVQAYYTSIADVIRGIKIYLHGVEIFDYDGTSMHYVSNEEVHPLDYNYMCECFSNLLNISVMDVQQKCLVYYYE